MYIQPLYEYKIIAWELQLRPFNRIRKVIVFQGKVNIHLI